jgi:hypothetical protein
VETDVYPSLDAINAAHSDTSGWLAPGENDIRRAAVSKDHNERLEQLMPCDETANVVPCRIGDIIVEDSTGDSVEIWKSD